MVKAGVFALLEKEGEKLLDILSGILLQSQGQVEFIKKANIEEIEKFVFSKKEKSDTLNAAVREFEDKIMQIEESSVPSDKERAREFLFNFKEKYRTLAQAIVDIECKDRDILLKMKQEAGLQIEEVQRAKARLQDIKVGYAHNLSEPLVFDHQG